MLEQTKSAIVSLDTIELLLTEELTDELIDEMLTRLKVNGIARKIVRPVLDALLPDIFFNSLRTVLERQAASLAAGPAVPDSSPTVRV